MKTWNVLIPCTMAVSVTVEAEDEEGAKAAAFAVDFSVGIKSEDKASPKVVDIETHERITYGNVYCGCICDMEVEEA